MGTTPLGLRLKKETMMAMMRQLSGKRIASGLLAASLLFGAASCSSDDEADEIENEIENEADEVEEELDEVEEEIQEEVDG